MEKDNLYVDIWRADKKGFYDLFQEFTDSKKDSHYLYVWMPKAIKWKDVEKSEVSEVLAELIKDTKVLKHCSLYLQERLYSSWRTHKERS